MNGEVRSLGVDVFWSAVPVDISDIRWIVWY